METNPVRGASQSSTSGSSALREVDLNSFIELMIAELQNQDPLNPMDNSQMLQQISQIREIEATDRLSGTLDSLLLGQQLATAAGLIGENVRGLSNAGSEVIGVVDKVNIEDGKTILSIGTAQVAIKNVREILPVAENADVVEVPETQG